MYVQLIGYSQLQLGIFRC